MDSGDYIAALIIIGRHVRLITVEAVHRSGVTAVRQTG